MTLFKRGDLPEPMPPEEVVEVASIGGGGEFIVRALQLSDRLQVTQNPERRVANMLARCVLYEDRSPVYSADQWEAAAARHYDDTMHLFEVALRLSGFGVPEKNG